MTPAAISDVLSFADTLELTRYRLLALLRAIVAGSYFDALFAAARSRTVLEHLDRLVQALPDDQQVGASRCLADLRALAVPILALAPVPACEPPDPLSSDRSVEPFAREDVQARWRRWVLHACIGRRAELDAIKRVRHDTCEPTE